MYDFLKNKYGYYDTDTHEYVITEKNTPKPWINIISNPNYGILISQRGGGYSWYLNSVINRITRWRIDHSEDNLGKYFFIREKNKECIIPLLGGPHQFEYDRYQCRHGLGYSKFSIESQETHIDTTVFVPVNDSCEIYLINIHNNSNQSKDYYFYSYMEWALGKYPYVNPEFEKLFSIVEYNNEINAVIAKKHLWDQRNKKGQYMNRTWDFVAGIASNIKPLYFECEKERFIGRYRNITNAEGLLKEKLENSQGINIDPITAMQFELNLAPNEGIELVFVIGVKENQEDLVEYFEKYRDINTSKAELEKVKHFWHEYLSKEELLTPDPSLNILANKWLKYQAISCRLWGKSAYYQDGGAFGYRDQLQDSQVYLGFDPQSTKKQILLHAGHQYKSGIVKHWWHPFSEDGPDSHHSDDLLWLVFVTNNYINETGDFSILEQKVGYLDGGEGTVLEHCLKSIEKVLERRSERGLPLICEGDWNDGLNGAGIDGKGESIWLAQFLYYILNHFVVILKRYNKEELAQKYDVIKEELKNKVNELGWDGEWFIYATDDNGNPIGSKICKEGYIHLNTQTWALLTEICDNERKEKVIDSVKKHLIYDGGPVLLYPAYSIPTESVGYISRYAPGSRENGGVYTHAAVWSIISFLKIKDVETAFELIDKINPFKRSYKNPELYKTEPYVLPGNSDGPTSKTYLTAGWTWYTGSAAWFVKMAGWYIAGIRPKLDYIIIDPVLKEDWQEFQYKRIIRGKEYKFYFEKGNLDRKVVEINKETILEFNKDEIITIPYLQNEINEIKVIL
ncbi:GH36-type glycosyl hydrolase domain-containing protein [Caldicellulosiruptoraceae bacterium PP1]